MKSIILQLLTAGIKGRLSKQDEELSLSDAIAKVDRVFGCNRILNQFEDDLTVPYYTQSEIGYRFYHSTMDSVHMALNFDGHFNAEGYKAQPKIVAEQLEKMGAKHVLEVGCGKGFNSLLLAQQYSAVQFTGIDLTPAHIAIANHKGEGLNNIIFQVGDFNALELPSEAFDLVFACESICHARQSGSVLSELFRILRPGGQLVVFDGYRRSEIESFSKELLIATQLVEIGMAVQYGFPQYTEWTDTAKSIGFSVASSEDITYAVQPTLLRLQRMSNKFFQSYWRSKLMTFLLPKPLVRNAVSGLLMPFTFNPSKGSLGYFQLVLTRD